MFLLPPEMVTLQGDRRREIQRELAIKRERKKKITGVKILNAH